MTTPTQELLAEIEAMLSLRGVYQPSVKLLQHYANALENLEAATLQRAAGICETVGKSSLIPSYEHRYTYQRAIDACITAIRKEIVK